MKFSFWAPGHHPSAGQIAVALTKVAALGAAIGMAASVLAVLHSGHWNEAAAVLGLSALCGSIYSVSFYVFCGLPWVYLGPLMQRFPTSFKYAITAMVGAVGSCAAISVAVVATSRVPGVQNEWARHMGPVLWGEAIGGAGIALVIGSFRKLQMDVVKAEARAHERELRESQLAELAAKAQAAALQSQINPHFFFNTLNTLSALIPVEACGAQEIVGRLGDMFRYTLACSRSTCVTLQQELEFTENYLWLEQARFRERLRVTLPRGEFGDIRLPGLSLQPLVENAIKYGVAKRVEGGEVEIAIRHHGTGCAIDVTSPAADDFDRGRFFRAGHALENVRERLRLFAGEEAGVDVSREERNRVRVTLVLPLGASVAGGATK